jgi:hypothetical protein
VWFSKVKVTLAQITMRLLVILFLATLAWSAPAQVTELKLGEILKLLPDKIDGFHPSEEPKSEQMKIGSITYTLCEKKFKAHEKSIQLLLFDFLHADIMYKQSVSKWDEMKPVDTESMVMRAIEMENCKGWASYQKHTEEAQISLGIGGRYLLNITGHRVDLAILQSVLSLVELEKFPK